MTKATTIASLAAALTLTACGNVADEELTGNRQAAGKSESGAIFCGGFGGLPCPEGYQCKLDGDYPDAGGSCVVKKKEECWGAWVDQNGTCRTPADGVYPDACCAGQFCGGIGGLPCPEGFQCKLDGDYPDAGGTCEKKEGQFCGGIGGLPCPEGYQCKLDGDYPDAGGTCEVKKPEPKQCHVGGCSSQLCGETPGAISTCEWMPEYACYQLSQCGAFGPNGDCGWKMTPDFIACLTSWGAM